MLIRLTHTCVESVRKQENIYIYIIQDLLVKQAEDGNNSGEQNCPSLQSRRLPYANIKPYHNILQNILVFHEIQIFFWDFKINLPVLFLKSALICYYPAFILPRLITIRRLLVTLNRLFTIYIKRNYKLCL